MIEKTKICPILTTSDTLIDCLKEKCAYWIDEEKCCYKISLSKNIKNFVNIMDEITAEYYGGSRQLKVTPY